jgi:predicted transposase/invertase (TIGR01784 family)
MKFADPKNDLAFKKIFGNENKKEILISFLNSVLDFKDKKAIVDVDLDNPYQLPDIKELKETILDIKATNQNGDKFIVEMQKKDLSNFDKRSLYYTSKAYVSQIDKGEEMINLKKVYYIAILNFNMFENKNYISRHLIINQETMTQDLKDFEFSFIELKKFNVKLEDLNTTIDKWIFFLNNASSFDLIPKEYEDIKEFQEAFQIANKFSWNKKELEYYDRVLMRQMDDHDEEQTKIKKEKERLEIAVNKSIKKEKIEIAKNLLDILDIETIALKIGLSIQEVVNLIKNNKVI